MRIDSVDFFYLSMPEIEDRGDGSQDALLVRVSDDRGNTGWGECEAAPLVSIASWCCPPSHSACRPLQDSVIGRCVDSAADIDAMGNEVRRRSFDLLQAPHTLSGIDIALWDLLGKTREEPVWKLLGFDKAFAKRPYASALFGDSPSDTFEKARQARAAGFGAVKFGWGPYGVGSVSADAEQVQAAREGLGDDADLFVDAGTVWGADVERAAARIAALETVRTAWLEEPFDAAALSSYAELASRTTIPLAGGEGAHNEYMARQTIDIGRVGFIQIDAGRIGGITPARRVAEYAVDRGVRYVNHTFTTPLALSASLQAYAGLSDHDICELPVEASALAESIAPPLKRDAQGNIEVPDAPGLGVSLNIDAMRRYLVEAEIRVGDQLLYRTPDLEA